MVGNSWVRMIHLCSVRSGNDPSLKRPKLEVFTVNIQNFKFFLTHADLDSFFLIIRNLK
jgi:hypothetical protein